MNQAPDALSVHGLIAEALVRHEATLFRYATRLLHDADQARDIVQETFAALGSTPPAAWADHTGAWLFTVCRRKALNVLRKQGRMTLLDDEATGRIPSPEADPAALLQHAEDRQQILALVSALPPAQREIVRLRYQEGFSYQEIGEITGRSANHVGVLLHTAVQSMRREWEASNNR
ncbi:RNA polymerase sigma factor, sigma-70 family [Opitutaceae bacterium TAV1]|nr:RNA polymerase subunit sigma-24 [Opitutaceae bacterium TAV5]EIP99196.1 RNA polymerase sigma factor, sigma-70 family [Opitutaceae bacterium TAV1]